jgi:hypothetical protein
MKNFALVGALGCGLALAGCGYGDSSDFSGDIERFFVEPATALPEVTFQRRGRILALDVETRRLDPLHDALPSELRARTPEEVGTIALIHCRTEEEGRYGYVFAKAYGQSCSLRLIDAKTRVFLATTGASRSAPLRVYIPFWPRTAARPTDILLDAIKRLPNIGSP